MDRNELSSQMEAFSTYPRLLAAEAQTEAARSATPTAIDNSSKRDLLAQIDYLDAKATQINSIRNLQIEVAEGADRLLPVAYSLGILAAYDIAIEDLRPKQSIRSHGPLMSDFLDNYRYLRPIDRAVKIGNALTEVETVFQQDDKVAVTMAWNGREVMSRHALLAVVAGTTRTKFGIRSPSVKDGLVKYHIPTKIQAIEDIEVIKRPEGIVDFTKPDIPEIAKLLRQEGRATPTELLLGTAATGRLVELRHEVAYRQSIKQIRRRARQTRFR